MIDGGNDSRMTKTPKNVVMVVAGTRPEAIKLSPVVDWLKRISINMMFVWSGQHYDYEMSELFIKQLGMPKPDLNLNIRGGTHAEQMARAMIGLERAIADNEPSIVVAQGDTNTVAASALATINAHVPFSHVEAGLRSFDRTTPEEINRVVVDSLSELLCAPTELAVFNLTHEGIPLRKIHLTGNTIVDVLVKHRDMAYRTATKLLDELNIGSGSYLLVTVHRRENVDVPDRLQGIIKALTALSQRYKMIFPMHPHTRQRLASMGLLKTLEAAENLRILPPVGYFEFLGLLSQSLVVLTDSGGVQEEALTMGIPTVTLRDNTERPETIQHGVNVLAGTDCERICALTEDRVQKSERLRKELKHKQNPLGDGEAGRKIALAIKDVAESGIRIE
jgi:UDP-N-acetylglucosamine 2-epimerase (non-hydrolysing)